MNPLFFHAGSHGAAALAARDQGPAAPAPARRSRTPRAAAPRNPPPGVKVVREALALVVQADPPSPPAPEAQP